MRDIRFRAWFKAKKRMLHFGNYSFCDEYDTLTFDLDDRDKTREYKHLAGHSYIPNEEGVVMQYTGLKDKQTLTDIYEGDIIDIDGNIRGNIYESPEVYKSLTTSVVAGMGYEDWENTKQGLVRQGKLIAEQSNLPQILRELG